MFQYPLSHLATVNIYFLLDRILHEFYTTSFPLQCFEATVTLGMFAFIFITGRKFYNNRIDIQDAYSLLFDSNPTPMWIYDAKTLCFLKLNNAALHKYGYSNEEFLAMTIKDIRPHSQIERLLQFNCSLKEYNEGSVWQHRKKNGDVFFVQVTSHVINYEGRDCRLAAAHDVTELIETKKQMEIAQQKMKDSLQRFETISRATNDAIWDWDLSTNHLQFNSCLHSVFGYEGNEFDIEFWSGKIHPEDVERVNEGLYKAIKNKSTLWSDEYRFRCENGSYKYVYDRGIPLYDEQGKPVRMIGLMQDVNDKRLQQTEINKLSLVAKFTNSSVIITDREAKIEWVNEAFTKLTGYTFEEVKGKRPSSFLHGKETDPVTDAEIKNLVESYKSFSTVVLNYRKDGSSFWVRTSVAPVWENNKVKNFVTIQTDVTEIMEKEEKIRKQNEKLRNIAFISSHETRKPVANILGLIEVFDTENLSNPENLNTINYLKRTTSDLDKVIHQIVFQTSLLDSDNTHAS